MSEVELDPEGPTSEGKVILNVKSTGGERGPGIRGGVFFNPAMVTNRDLSVILVDTLLKRGELPGRNISILDGLCGSGIRTLRFAREIGDLEGVLIRGIDLDERSIETALKGNIDNGVSVDFQREELNSHLVRNRYSYIDVDPFGSPVPFIRNAISSLLNNGVLAITATDTAALTGSIPRVARRRYDTNLHRTSFQHELSCRALLGHLTRTAASMERSVTPLLFYSSDHFVRGYVRIGRGAGRTDSSLGSIGYLLMDDRGNTDIVHRPEGIIHHDGERKVIGPIWVGPLENHELVSQMLESVESGQFSYIETHRQIATMLGTAIQENGLPPGGYDTNDVASLLGMSPPPMAPLMDSLKGRGFDVSRSRFSPTLIKTDAPWKVFKRIFIDYEGGD